MPRIHVLAPLVPLALAACAVVGPAVPVVVAPGGSPGPAPSVRDVFADVRDATPKPSVAPTVPPRQFETGRPLDVAIAGPGYLAVASRPDPRGWSDVALVRGGRLGLIFQPESTPLPGSPGAPVSGPGAWSLRTADQRWVLGFELSRDPDFRAPSEARATAFSSAFRLDARDAGPLRLPAPTSLAPALTIDFRGRLTIAGQAPATEDGDPRWLYLAVVRVDDPAKLLAAPGGGFRYDAAAGFAYVGVAGLTSRAGDERPVGDAVVLKPGWLEDEAGI